MYISSHSPSQRSLRPRIVPIPRVQFEHEVRREVTLQAMRWLGQVDDADERWEMDVEKVVRQVGLGILRQFKVDFYELFFSPSFQQ